MGNKKKKLLILVDWFAPGYKAGGPIRSCVNLSLALKDDYEVFVLTTDKDHGEDISYQGITTNYWNHDFHPQVWTYYAKKNNLTLKQVKREILAVKADYIYLNHLFSPKFVIYPLWLKFTKSLAGTVVVCPRGALFDSALSIKKTKKLVFLKLLRSIKIQKLVLFHATNEREKDTIEHFFPKSKVIIADNLPNFQQTALKIIEKKSGHLKAVFIARIHPIKNLLFLIKLLQEVKQQIELTIVGPIEDKAYWEDCKKYINELPSNVKATYLGALQNDKIEAVLTQHHIFILLTEGENFGHSIFEALLAGRPVLISDQTPWLQLTEKKVGWDLPLNDPNQFIRAIETAAEWDQGSYEEWAHSTWKFANDFLSSNSIKEQYYQLFS